MKRGVSPLISVILLLVTVVSIAGSIFLFIKGLSTKLSGKISRNVETVDNYKIRFLPISYCKWYNDYSNRTVDIILYFENEGSKIKNTTLMSLAIKDIDGNNLYTIIDEPLLKYDCNRDEICFISLLGLDLVKKEPYEIYLTIGKNDFVYEIKECRKDKNLVLYLKFDEGSGNVTYDYSTYHNHGILLEATGGGDIVIRFGRPSIHEILYSAYFTNKGSLLAEWVDGKLERALNFDREDDYVEVSDSPSLNVNKITIGAWIKTTQNASSAPQILGKVTSDGIGGYALFLYGEDGSGYVYGLIYTNDWQWIESTTPVNDGNWHFIAFTFDGSSLKVYIDGILNNQTNISGSINQVTAPILIGVSKETGENIFDGTIDEIRIYNRALSEQEIKELYYGIR